MNEVSEMLSAIKQGATLLFPFVSPLGLWQQVQVDQYGWYWFDTIDKRPRSQYTSIYVIEEVLEELKDFPCEIL